MRMRQSLEDLEQAFAAEISRERSRRRSLVRTTEQRSLRRDLARQNKRGSLRFAGLVLALVLTAAFVTVVMFRVLYLLLA